MLSLDLLGKTGTEVAEAWTGRAIYEPIRRLRTAKVSHPRHNMKRIGILTAGGDTPALNATIHGAVVRANDLKVEVYGLFKGFNSLFNPRLPHVRLNPLFQAIPEQIGRA